jgi:hypothetical protein
MADDGKEKFKADVSFAFGEGHLARIEVEGRAKYMTINQKIVHPSTASVRGHKVLDDSSVLSFESLEGLEAFAD